MEYLIFSLVIIVLILGFTYHGGILKNVKRGKGKKSFTSSTKSSQAPIKKVDAIRLLRRERRKIQAKYYNKAGTTQPLPSNRKCACGGQIITQHPIFKCQKCSQKFKYIREEDIKSA